MDYLVVPSTSSTPDNSISIFNKDGSWNFNHKLQKQTPVGTGDYFTNAFRSELHNLEGFYLSHSGKRIRDYDVEAKIIDISKSADLTVMDVLGPQLLDIMDKKTFKRFSDVYGTMKYHELWEKTAFKASYSSTTGETTVYTLKQASDLSGIFPKKVDGVRYESLTEYYIANFVYPIDRLVYQMNLLDNKAFWDNLITWNPNINGLGYFDVIFLDDSTRLRDINTNTLTGITTARNVKYQLNAFLHPVLDDVLWGTISSVRGWENVNFFQKASWWWAVAITIRNSILGQGFAALLINLRKIDEILSKII